ncbi:MAG: hypothetical protein HC938_03775 [Nitrospira sp.]|nr:hypothetical protein [Nitrospira sp.]
MCPLTDGEVRQLYGSHETLTSTDEAQLAVPQPALVELVAPADFRLLATERAGAELRAQTHRPELWNGTVAASYTATQLQDLHQRVKQAAAILAEEHHWLREVLFAGWSGGDLQEAWQDLLVTIETLASESGTAQRLIMAHGPTLPENHRLDDAALMLGDIVSFLEAGGSFGLKTKLTRRAWHHLMESCRVEGRAPRTLEEFRALHASAQLETSRNRFAPAGVVPWKASMGHRSKVWVVHRSAQLTPTRWRYAPVLNGVEQYGSHSSENCERPAFGGTPGSQNIRLYLATMVNWHECSVPDPMG